MHTSTWPNWLRSRWLRVAIASLAAWLALSGLAFGPALKWGAKHWVHTHTDHQLDVGAIRFNPLTGVLTIEQLRVHQADGALLLGLDELRVDVEFESVLHAAWVIRDVTLVAPQANGVRSAQGEVNLQAFVSALIPAQSEQTSQTSATPPRFEVQRAQVIGGHLRWRDETVQPPMTATVTELALDVQQLSSITNDRGAIQAHARFGDGSQVQWQGHLSLKPIALTGALSLEGVQLATWAPYWAAPLQMAAPQGRLDFSTRLFTSQERTGNRLRLTDTALTLRDLQLRRTSTADPALKLKRLALSQGELDVFNRRVSWEELHVDGAAVTLSRRQDGRLDLQDWWRGARPSPAQPDTAHTSAAAPEPEASNAQPWHFGIQRVSVQDVSLQARDERWRRPLTLLLHASHLGLGIQAQWGTGEPQVLLNEGVLALDEVQVRSGSAPLLSLREASLHGLSLNLADRQLAARELVLSGGQTEVTRQQDGRLNWLDAIDERPAVAQGPSSKTPSASPAPQAQTSTANAAGWRWQLERASLQDWRMALRDQQVQPPATFVLQAIDAELRELSENLNTPWPLSIKLKARSGGSLALDGSLQPQPLRAQAKLKLSGFSLTPLQPYLDEWAHMQLVSGRLNSVGQLQLSDQLRYAGALSVTDFKLLESESGERLLAWERLSTSGLQASERALTVGEVNVHGLGTKIVIHPDKTLNWVTLLKPRARAEPQSSPTPADGAPAFSWSVERITLGANALDFADESLALPFGTRIHHLKGSINGVRMVPGQTMQLALDGQVDDYGLARAAGEVNLLDPKANTDIKAIFRNVDMQALSPYSATFAGRRIDSGKLSLDLTYKIKDGQMIGENQIIMNKLVLGDRVDSPSAKNLPLDLAVALLEDADGVIDLGLPVSGSLSDPQFSYGAIVWKAIVNVIGKIALAPFRALGKLAGIDQDEMARVGFDAGSSVLLPPERDKLNQVAAALTKRPNLKLQVNAAWAPKRDDVAIREDRLRRAVAQALGRQLETDQDPGPVSTAEPKVQQALERLALERLGQDTLATMRSRFTQDHASSADQPKQDKVLSKLSEQVAQEAADGTPVGPNASFHALLYQKLLAHERVETPSLQALAVARAGAIQSALSAAGVTADRISIAPAQALDAQAEPTLKLALTAATPAAPLPARP